MDSCNNYFEFTCKFFTYNIHLFARLVTLYVTNQIRIFINMILYLKDTLLQSFGLTYFYQNNVLKMYWNACKYVLSKQLKLWNVY